MSKIKLQIVFKQKKIKNNWISDRSEYARGPILEKIVDINFEPAIGMDLRVDNQLFKIAASADINDSEISWFGHATIYLKDKFEHPLNRKRKVLVNELKDKGWEEVAPIQLAKKSKYIRDSFWAQAHEIADEVAQWEDWKKSGFVSSRPEVPPGRVIKEGDRTTKER